MTISAAQPLLEAKSLCAWYGAAQILYDVDLTVQRGEVVALMGRLELFPELSPSMENLWGMHPLHSLERTTAIQQLPPSRVMEPIRSSTERGSVSPQETIGWLSLLAPHRARQLPTHKT